MIIAPVGIWLPFTLSARCSATLIDNKSEGLLLDIYSLNASEQREETAIYEYHLLSGFFWSPENYYGFLNTSKSKYEREKAIPDKYTIVEASQTKAIYNWLQYFSLESIRKEFRENGFRIDGCYSDLGGTLCGGTSSRVTLNRWLQTANTTIHKGGYYAYI